MFERLQKYRVFFLPSRNTYYDIGLVRLREPFNLAAIGAAPTCLLISKNQNYQSHLLQVAGYGLFATLFIRRRDPGYFRDAGKYQNRTNQPDKLGGEKKMIRKKRQADVQINEPVVVRGSNLLRVTNVYHHFFYQGYDPVAGFRSRDFLKDVCGDRNASTDPSSSMYNMPGGRALEEKSAICANSYSSTACPGDSGGKKGNRKAVTA